MTSERGAKQREFELKLAVPSRARAALRRAIAADPAWSRASTLQARYFDTEDRRLARAGMALRVRREGRGWVQVLKASRPGDLARDEHSVERPDGTLDLDALRATPALGVIGERRLKALALALRYETTIRRRTRTVRTRGGAVELAFDEGWIASGDRRVPVCELEIELVRGSARAVFAQALRWRRRFGLVLDARTKAERGDCLARAASPNEPRRAARVSLAGAMSPGEALRAIAIECASQIQANAADIAMGAGDDEHVHQLRVGIRRLRSAWRFFDGWTAPPPPELLEGARAVFSGMGAARDAAVLAGEIEPRLKAAGMPPMVEPPAVPTDHPHKYAAGPVVQEWLLALFGWIDEIDVAPLYRARDASAGATAPAAAAGDAAPAPIEAADSPASPPADAPARGGDAGWSEAIRRAAGATHVGSRGEALTIARLARRRLGRWHARLCAAAKGFDSLPDAQRHRLRKRAKRLRYATEFCRDLLRGGDYDRCIRRLARLQEVLGELSDLAVARARYEHAPPTEPAAWFARGWIAARTDAVVPLAIEAFARLAKAGPVRD